MGWRLPARSAIRRWRGTRDYHRYLRALAAPLLAALVQGCTAASPSVAAGPLPSNWSAPVPSVGYQSTIAPYSSLRPLQPTPPRQQSEQPASLPNTGE
jgi:hypothetical protein